MFQTKNSVISNNVSLKYQRFATLNSKDIGIINSEFVAKTQFLSLKEACFLTITKKSFYFMKTGLVLIPENCDI